MIIVKGRMSRFRVKQLMGFMMLLSFNGANVHKGTRFKLVNMAKRTFNESRAACHSMGPEWELPNDLLREQDLPEFKLANTWVAYTKITFPNFKWMNGLSHSIKHREAGGSCAGLAVAIEDVQSIPCAEKGVGYICQLPSGIPCPHYYSYMCIPFDDFLFVIGCGVSDWYDAQNVCSSFGGDLAILDTKAKIKRILAFINSKSLYDKCGWSFAGLRKEEWRATFKSTVMRPAKMYWTEATEIYSATGECLTFNFINKSFAIVQCTSQHHTLCQYYGSKLPEQPPKNQETSQISGDIILRFFLAVFVLGTLVLVCTMLVSYRIQRYPGEQDFRQEACAMCFSIPFSIRNHCSSICNRCRTYMFYHKRDPDEAENGQSSERKSSISNVTDSEMPLRSPVCAQEVYFEVTASDETETKDTVNLRKKNLAGAIPNHVLENPKSRIGVVMFSNGVNPSLPNCEKSTVVNIQLHKTDKKLQEQREGNTVALSIVETFENLTNCSLTLINIVNSINVRLNCFDLRELEETQLLDFLITNCDGIHRGKLVIFLPLLRYNLLDKVRLLRSKAVIISLADMMPKLPTTEVITAIGENEEMELYIIADIVIKVNLKKMSKSDVEITGAAHAVGLGAAILHVTESDLPEGADLTSTIYQVMSKYLLKHKGTHANRTSKKAGLDASEVREIVNTIIRGNHKEFLGWQTVDSVKPPDESVEIDEFIHVPADKSIPFDEINRIKIAFILEERSSSHSFSKDTKWNGECFLWNKGQRNFDSTTEKRRNLKETVHPEEVKYFMETVSKYFDSAHRYVQITVYEIDSKDVNCLSYIQSVLEQIKDHIVFLKCIDLTLPDDHPLMKATASLKEHSILLSAAKTIVQANSSPMRLQLSPSKKARHPFPMPQFPVTQSIAIGKVRAGESHQVQGSPLDFVCDKHTPYEAAVSVVALVVLLLLEIQNDDGISNDTIRNISTTPMMQRIIREMCSHPHQHESLDGWGVLDIKQAIETKLRDHHQLCRLFSVNPEAISWNGKNL